MSLKIIEHLDNHFKNKKENINKIKNNRGTVEIKKKKIKEEFDSYEEKYKNIKHCFKDFNNNHYSENQHSNSLDCNIKKNKNEQKIHPHYTRFDFIYSTPYPFGYDDSYRKENKCKINSNSPVSNNYSSLPPNHPPSLNPTLLPPPKSFNFKPLSFHPALHPPHLYENTLLNEFHKQLSDIILNPHNLNNDKEIDGNKYNDTEIPVIEKKYIDVEINSLDDLIHMIDNNPITDNIEYNIDMKMMHNIKPHLIELNDMIGMKSLKDNVVDQIIYFSQGLHKSPNKNEGDFMHTVIYGPPGTGKTEVSKILGNIYSKLGILTKNTFRKVTRADLIAGYLGQTAIKTKEVINSCIGGVLFIDEAYSLGSEEKRDSFSKECIDTLCESLSDHKDKLMVIIAGYEKELENCFFNLNQGLNSRFPWRFKIEKYTPSELKDIFTNKIAKNGWLIKNSENSIIEKEWFERHINYFKYYGRDMETLFAKTKIAHAKRVFCKPIEEKKILTLDDINKGFNMFLLNEEVINRNKDKNTSQLFIYL